MNKFVSNEQIITVEPEVTAGVPIKPTKGYGIKTASISKKNALVELNENDGERLIWTNLMKGVTTIDWKIESYGNMNILSSILPSLLGKWTTVAGSTTYDLINWSQNKDTLTIEVEKGAYVWRYSWMEASDINLTGKAGEDSSISSSFTFMGRKGTEVEKIKNIAAGIVEFSDSQTLVLNDIVKFVDSNNVTATTAGGALLDNITVTGVIDDKHFTFSTTPNIWDNCVLHKAILLTANRFVKKNPLQLKNAIFTNNTKLLTCVKDFSIDLNANKQKEFCAGSDSVSYVYEKGLKVSWNITVDVDDAQEIIALALSNNTSNFIIEIKDDYNNSLLVDLLVKFESTTDLALNDLITTKINFKTVKINNIITFSI